MIDRRRFLMLSAGALASASSLQSAAALVASLKLKAVAFDGLAIFDSRPVGALAESFFPGKGAAIINTWRVRQFDYQWLRVLGGRYADFMEVTEESLLFTMKQMQLDLSAEKRQMLMSTWLNLTVWPDVPEAIKALRANGLRLAFLSNMTSGMLTAGVDKANLGGAFDVILSTDQIRSYKPDPRAYQMAVDHMHLSREEILFVAFAGWDVAGAKWFGYPTAWVNRLGSPAEELGIEADVSVPDLNALLKALTAKS
jgi:2-haloacid dehalogenase